MWWKAWKCRFIRITETPCLVRVIVLEVVDIATLSLGFELRWLTISATGQLGECQRFSHVSLGYETPREREREMKRTYGGSPSFR